MRFLFFFMVFFQSSFSQEIIVNNKKGKVYFVLENEKKLVEDYKSYSDPKGFFLLENDNSSMTFRIVKKNGEFNFDIISHSAKKNKFLIKDLLNVSNDGIEGAEGSFFNKALDYFFNNTVNKNQIDNNYSLSKANIVYRNINDSSLVKLNDIKVLSGIKFKIDFSKYFKVDSLNEKKFQIIIKDRWAKKTIFDSYTSNLEFEYKIPKIKDSNLNLINDKYLNIEIINSNNSKRINFNVLTNEQFNNKDLINSIEKLKELAFNELNTSLCKYQIFLIETLISNQYFANAKYLIDYFILKKDNSKLKEFRNHYLF